MGALRRLPVSFRLRAGAGTPRFVQGSSLCAGTFSFLIKCGIWGAVRKEEFPQDYSLRRPGRSSSVPSKRSLLDAALGAVVLGDQHVERRHDEEREQRADRHAGDEDEADRVTRDGARRP